jgi:hypothetical protein
MGHSTTFAAAVAKGIIAINRNSSQRTELCNNLNAQSNIGISEHEETWRFLTTDSYKCTFNNPFYVNFVIHNIKPKRYGFKYSIILFSAVGLTWLGWIAYLIEYDNETFLSAWSVSFVRNLRCIFNRTDYTYMAENGRTIVGAMWRETVVACL